MRVRILAALVAVLVAALIAVLLWRPAPKIIRPPVADPRPPRALVLRLQAEKERAERIAERARRLAAEERADDRRLKRVKRRLREVRQRLRRELAWPFLIRLGRSLQRHGFRVSEHPAFGGVEPVHEGEAHYEGRALDVNAAPGESAYERQRLAWAYAYVAGLPHISLVLYPGNDPAHDDHMHIEGT